MSKKARHEDEPEELDAALPETEELPHDRFPPIWRNIYWGQVVMAVLATVLFYRIRAIMADDNPKTQLLLALHVLGAVLLAIVFLVYLNNLYKHGLVPDYSKKCRFCEGPVNRYSEFCEHCGADLISEEKLVKCPRCQADVYEGTKHCPDCGAKLTGGKHGKAAKKGKGGGPPPGDEGWNAPLGVDNPRPWEK